MLFRIIAAVLAAVLVSCSDQMPTSSEKANQQPNSIMYDEPDPANEDRGIITPEDSLISFTREVLYGRGFAKASWSEATHKNIAYLVAKNLGLPEARASIIRDASEMPDFYQSGLDNLYNQQWSHNYILQKVLWSTVWIWGDADDDFHDNIDGCSGESESPEGYNGKWAGYYYSRGNKDLGDWYVGYACHFIQDVSLGLHTTIPDQAMFDNHNNFEEWVKNNWTSGYQFANYASAVPAASYYTISSLKPALQSAAKGSCHSFSPNAKNAWEAYKASGYPTASGAGSPDAVFYTSKMVQEATKWTGGAVKYAMSKYGQW